MAILSGLEMNGFVVRIEPDLLSKDGTKLLIQGIPPGSEWQELKDFCSQAGRVAFAAVNKASQSPAAAPVQFAPQRLAAPAAGGACTGEVRYAVAQHAQIAAQSLHGTMLGRSQILVQLDLKSQDGTRVLVHNLPAGTSWQALKEHFGQIGHVVFSQVHRGESPRGGAPPPVAPAYPAARGGACKAVGEVRYSNPGDAQAAIAELSGRFLKGHSVTIKADNTSKDGAKVLIMGISSAVDWKDIKDFMSEVGPVAYAKVTEIPGVAAPAPSAAGRSAYGGRESGGMGGGAAYGGGGQGAVGEVRFDDPAHAQMAVDRVNGTFVNGSKVYVSLDQASHDGAKIVVTGLKPSFRWQELKDIFSHIGQVAYAAVTGTTAASTPAHGGAVASRPGRPRIISHEGGCGEVRYANPAHAQNALVQLNGSEMRGSIIQVTEDARSQDGSKLFVQNLPGGIEWQELKDHFAECGEVAFSGIFGHGEVRMSTADEAAEAVHRLNGSMIGDSQIVVETDPASHDGSKLIVMNLPPQCQWQELKDHFGQCGVVAFAGREGGPGGGRR
eukprot:TRINITY_DN6439_c2_g1_i1.p1 TRINITY_DN6439_c2_g1~~TRINITY_DN6439_c2_g1_i1.p1  ORF type:complete len:581 (-),score=132.50 TRINITY_DN6439_c2_g1_i1:275-1939(-)